VIRIKRVITIIKWAWKQPSFKESVIAHLSNFFFSKM